MRKLIGHSCMIDLAGLGCLIAYLSLMYASWGREEVSLTNFFLCLSIAWIGTLGVFAVNHSRQGDFSITRIVLWALAFRLVGFFAGPIFEDDIYRYLWDGRNFAELGNPYAFAPVESFSDFSLSDRLQLILDNINNPDLPTIYGPFSQLVFFIGYLLALGKLWGVKLVILLAELLTFRLLYQMVAPKNLVLYAWCPLVIIEAAFNSHIDCVGVMLLVGALYFFSRHAFKRSALLLALSVTTKMFALLAVPFLIGFRDWRSWGIFGTFVLAIYFPFLLQDGYAGLYTTLMFFQEWEFNSSIFGLCAWVFDRHVAKTVCGLAFLVFFLLYWKQYTFAPRTHLPRLDWIIAIFFFSSAVLNPWYLLWLVPFVVIFPSYWGVASLAVVSLSYVHGLMLPYENIAPYQHPSWVRPLEFGVIGLAFVADLYRVNRGGRKSTELSHAVL